jgi:hypothetical protein
LGQRWSRQIERLCHTYVAFRVLGMLPLGATKIAERR